MMDELEFLCCCNEPEEVQKEPNLKEPWTGSDVVFMVEEKKIYANKAILSIWSPVFRTMFRSDFREMKSNYIPLPEKRYDDILTLFELCHVPMETVTGSCVDTVLPLAEEYQMEKILKQCETALSHKSLESLLLAKQYGFADLEAKCIDFLKRQPVSYYSEKEFDKLGPETCIEIIRFRSKRLERLVPLLKELRKVTKLDKISRSGSPSRGCFACGKSRLTEDEMACASYQGRWETLYFKYIMCAKCAIRCMARTCEELIKYDPDNLFC